MLTDVYEVHRKMGGGIILISEPSYASTLNKKQLNGAPTTHTTNIKTLSKTLPTSVSTHHLRLNSVTMLVSVPNESQLQLPTK